MSCDSKDDVLFERRKILKGIISLSILGLTTACGGGGISDEPQSDGSADSDTEDAGDSNDSTESPIATTVPWAAGGTQSMTANFPDDSLFAMATSCTLALTGRQTEGPCYFEASDRDDISEQESGLPMMICLQLVDSNCNPLSAHEIEVWHCNTAGLYSGDTAGSPDAGRFNSGFCTGNDNQARGSTWFRGTLVTDSSGRVNFKSCFPGWYPSRAIHVHFRVKNNNQ